MRKIAFGIFAHLYDAEFICIGTLSLLKNAGCSISNFSMAKGNKGRTDFSRKEINNIRKPEAQRDT
jgi:LmbE family N-acetylglucosaminyl deacetylase